jgi:hypothetical protein
LTQPECLPWETESVLCGWLLLSYRTEESRENWTMELGHTSLPRHCLWTEQIWFIYQW